LRKCLEAILSSTFSNIEVIVVDDASTDESRKIAQEFNVELIENSTSLGPAAARNRGAASAKGSILLFIDADVAISSQTIASVVQCFAKRPDVAAVFGSYDDDPIRTNVVSQYKNLMHHYIHQISNPDATTFWTGLGAIQKDVFLRIGGFNEQRYRYPCIEDVELGYRLKNAGYKILLDKQLQGKHLKRWTLRKLVETDILRRAIPWTQLILETGKIPEDLNFRSSHRMSSLLVCLLLGSMPLLVIRHHAVGLLGPLLPLIPLVLFGTLLVLNRQIYRFFLSRMGWLSTSAAVVLHLGYYLYGGITFALTWMMYRFFKAPATEAFLANSSDASMLLLSRPEPRPKGNPEYSCALSPAAPKTAAGGGDANVTAIR
jgi:GT2 family glycosyltransferase